MFSASLKNFHKHYVYYMSLFSISVVSFFLLYSLLSAIGSVRMELFAIINKPIGFYEKISIKDLTDLVSSQVSKQFMSINGFLTVIFSLVNAYLIIAFIRSVFQKLNFPNMRILDSAYFHTSPLQVIRLSLKLIFTQLCAVFAISTLWTLVLAIISRILSNNSSVYHIGTSFFILMGLALNIFIAPISYLVAYDVDEKYNFLTTISKGVSLGLRYFWRILKTVMARFLLITFITFVYVGFGIVLVASYESTNVMIMYIMFGMLFAILWTIPFCLVYMAKTMNKIFEKEY